MSTQPVWTPNDPARVARSAPVLEGRQPTAPHPEDVRMNARLATYPNSEAERETLKAVDDAVFQRVREWEQYLVQAARQARVDAQVDTTAAQDTIDALQGEIRFALDRPIGEVQNNIGELAARYKTLRVIAERAIEALGRADHNEEAWAAKLADPYADLVALWSRWPMVRPQV